MAKLRGGQDYWQDVQITDNKSSQAANVPGRVIRLILESEHTLMTAGRQVRTNFSALMRPSEPCTEGARLSAAPARCAVLPRELCTEAQAEPVPWPLLALSASSLEFSVLPLDLSAMPSKGDGASRTYGLEAGLARAGDAAATGGCAGLLRCCGTACCGAALTVRGADSTRRQGRCGEGLGSLAAG